LRFLRFLQTFIFWRRYWGQKTSPEKRENRKKRENRRKRISKMLFSSRRSEAKTLSLSKGVESRGKNAWWFLS